VISPTIEVMLMMRPRCACAWRAARGLGHGYRAKDVHRELAAQIVERGFLDCALVAVAGIVDQDVDRADLAFDAVDRRLDLVVVRYVRDHAERATGDQRRECLPLILVAERANHAVPCRQGGVGDGAAETRADAGDEPGSHRSGSL
jgi:hypothetical protein